MVLTSEANLNTQNGKSEIVLDWSSYDVSNKYFVIYRKQENSQDWKRIVDLGDKFNANQYVDVFGDDKNTPTIPNINVSENVEQNNIHINVSANDFGTKYKYYVESYDLESLELLNLSL